MAGDLKIEIKIPFKRLRIPPKSIDEILKIALNDIKKRTPVATGKLKRGIKKRKTPKGGEIYIEGQRNNEVANYQHFGTHAHWIRPRRAKVLAWRQGGRWRFSMGHRVRGIKAKRFFKISPTALRQMKNTIQFLKDSIGLRRK